MKITKPLRFTDTPLGSALAHNFLEFPWLCQSQNPFISPSHPATTEQWVPYLTIGHQRSPIRLNSGCSQKVHKVLSSLSGRTLLEFFPSTFYRSFITGKKLTSLGAKCPTQVFAASFVIFFFFMVWLSLLVHLRYHFKNLH